MASKNKEPISPKKLKRSNNFVSEWFGHRVYPYVALSSHCLDDQRTGSCPFLSRALGQRQGCIKSAASKGICTITTVLDDGIYQDWIVCPYRIIDDSILNRTARDVFGITEAKKLITVPASALVDPQVRSVVADYAIDPDSEAVLYFQHKLGGEISIPPTASTPELSFDILFVEVIANGGAFSCGRYALLEVQTMDFHGSYRNVVRNLQDALRLHGDDFPEAVSKRVDWLSDHVEGPNISNVFKRTFYQIMVKFKLDGDPLCAGGVLALPRAVWNSWQRHLGGPSLIPIDEDCFEISSKGSRGRLAKRADVSGSKIYVLDFVYDRNYSPASIDVGSVIITTVERLLEQAFMRVPQILVSKDGAVNTVMPTIRRRLRYVWPGFADN